MDFGIGWAIPEERKISHAIIGDDESITVAIAIA
jgi:hypothetical protein